MIQTAHKRQWILTTFLAESERKDHKRRGWEENKQYRLEIIKISLPFSEIIKFIKKNTTQEMQQKKRNKNYEVAPLNSLHRLRRDDPENIWPIKSNILSTYNVYEIKSMGLIEMEKYSSFGLLNFFK